MHRFYRRHQALYAAVTLHVPCRYLKTEGETSRCSAHGFQAQRLEPAPYAPLIRRAVNGRATLVENGHLTTRTLTPRPEAPAARALPVLPAANPCATARCRTADNRIGAACCRDLQVEILCDQNDTEREALIRSRQSPYLCKISREGRDSIDAEMISACSYLEGDGIHCSLHGWLRPDGRTAKPDLCFDWPGNHETLHPGCVFQPASPTS
jgi:hypothetical protein